MKIGPRAGNERCHAARPSFTEATAFSNGIRCYQPRHTHDRLTRVLDVVMPENDGDGRRLDKGCRDGEAPRAAGRPAVRSLVVPEGRSINSDH